MTNKIPNSIIDDVSSVLSRYHQSHGKLDSLFRESGAPGAPPQQGNCETKCSHWLKRCNEDPTVDPLQVLGRVIQKFMDLSDERPEIGLGQERIRASLAKNQLTYQMNGVITVAGASLTAQSLENLFKVGDYPSIKTEFNRAISQVDRDPHAAITAASAIIEAMCKTYIGMHMLEMPSKQTIGPLWKVMQQHLGLNVDPMLADDQKRILGGLVSIVDGVGAYRTHIGSAHGRGIEPPTIVPAEARLAVHASHTIVMFVMEMKRWRNTTPSTESGFDVIQPSSETESW